ncbi:MAG TPA: biotin--[acetyl-CoA-carboxylase] ligase [Clostridia bacterium]|nr:biotin--[acetyl-CoA-carboxylase] ligase [Clostridia bacterium]
MRGAILQYLRNNGSAWVSGEEICQSLSISRTAVWKHINQLRQLGYEIEAQPRSGYRLLQIPDRLYPEEIKHGLATKMVGQNIIYLEKTVSTNIDAKELAEGSTPEGSVVVSEEQVKGRGRLGRSWYSPYGKNLLFSLILYPQVNPMETPQFTLLTAVAVTNAIGKACNVTPAIKWPNDLLLEGKKVCGILVELSAEINKVNYIVIGQGINVNMDAKDFPEEVEDTATSLKGELGRPVDRVELLRTIFREFEDRYYLWQVEGFKPILDEYKKNCFNLGRSARIISGSEHWEGTVEDIGHDGALLLRLGNGELKRFIAGEVKLRGR